MNIKKLLVIAIILIMIFALIGCDPLTNMQISTYMINTGQFIKHNNYLEWTVFVPSPTNPNWLTVIRFSYTGIMEYATMSLQEATAQYDQFLANGWMAISESQVPQYTWNMLVAAILGYTVTFGLSEFVPIFMPYQLKPTNGTIDWWPTETPVPGRKAPSGQSGYSNPGYPAPSTSTVTPMPTSTPKK